LEKVVVDRYDLLIVNRSFWPVYPVIGEGLLRVAESFASSKKIAVILQDHAGIRKHLKELKRGVGVNFFPVRALSNSSSSLVIRVLDSIFFMFWVFFCLIRTRPKNIYISTDPPILVPFIIAIFSKIMNFKYIYHLQDIHPEASNVVVKINRSLFNLLKKIDNFSMRHASLLITLNEEMKIEILRRTNIKKEIAIIENPSIPFNIKISIEKKRGFSFTGNIGRLQRIPLLINAIKEYSQRGGSLEFAFAGGGIFSNQISDLSKNISLIKNYGFVTSEQAGSISSTYEWALAPIEDEVTRYAFPSKISSYVCSGAKILAICSNETSVAKWIKTNQVGIVVKPTVDAVVDIFFKIEKNKIDTDFINIDRKELKKNLHMDRFVKNIKSKIFPLYND
jgi:glycosyltransferase involved in cell wall biosynthesis